MLPEADGAAADERRPGQLRAVVGVAGGATASRCPGSGEAGGDRVRVAAQRRRVVDDQPAIAIAAYDRAHGSPNAATQALIRRAITESDNAAAQSLWDRLGGGSRAAGLVQRVLSAAGDTQTTVHSTVSRAGYSAFGQTGWSLRNQLNFMAGMTCLPHGLPVLGLMNEIVSSQRGDSARRAQACSRAAGARRVRAPISCARWGSCRFAHPVAVTIATVPRDRSFNSGTANLTKIARWLRSHLDPGSAPVTPRC